ncbi:MULTISPECIES: hypothetical protein [Streptomyces]|uniref:hypothetical protein n=1 Tax=Streptomyces TaxID=1883 RepID=UPI00191255F4|nr:hypothetical protein [Streptomyces sp. MBT58]MBK5993394.1 hypothetical protein [Streptomyces sp. MBT58]
MSIPLEAVAGRGAGASTCATTWVWKRSTASSTLRMKPVSAGASASRPISRSTRLRG